MTARPLGLVTGTVLPPALDHPSVRDFQGTKVEFNEKKMTVAATGASTPGLVADLIKTLFLRRSFADKRE